MYGANPTFAQHWTRHLLGMVPARWLSALQTQGNGGLRVAVLDEKDEPAVVDCLRRLFYPRESLNVGLDFHQDGEWPCMEAFDTMALEQGLSLGAFSAENQLVAMTLNAAYTVEEDRENRVTWNSIRDDVPLDASNLKTQEEKFEQIVRVLQRINAESEIFVKYPSVSKILDLNVITVDDAWCGKGIGKLLTSRSRDLAKSKGFLLARAVATSPISASLLKALNFLKIHELDLSEILDARGQPVYKPPHQPVVSYIGTL